MSETISSMQTAAFAAANYLDKNFSATLDELRTLARIPSVSFANFPATEVARSAHAVADLLKRVGLKRVEILTVEKNGVPGEFAHPYVYGELLEAPGAPTVLLYAHHDVQPPGREDLWLTPPWEPTLKEGPGGMRLYGRGTADDKAGVIVHTSAIEAYLQTGKKLPVNVKIVIEGEEEIGSGHLKKFLTTYRDRLDADVLVLTDTTNFDCGVPALTTALRGLVGVEIEVRALTKAVHSGMWGGPIPDPAMALAKMLATLTDGEGRIAIPEIIAQVKPVSAEEEARLKLLPYEEKIFREQVGLVAGAKLLKEGPSPIAQVFRFPSLTVNAIQASSRQQAGNIINDTAWAKVTIRLVADMDPASVKDHLLAHLRKVTPWGLEVTLKSEGEGAPAWSIDPRGAAFEAAIASMKKGYGKEPLMIGCGGSIPFVKPFAEALGGVPALLVGVEDPYTNAHGENESLLVSDLRKACLSQVYLFEELAARLSQKT